MLRGKKQPDDLAEKITGDDIVKGQTVGGTVKTVSFPVSVRNPNVCPSKKDKRKTDNRILSSEGGRIDADSGTFVTEAETEAKTPRSKKTDCGVDNDILSSKDSAIDEIKATTISTADYAKVDSGGVSKKVSSRRPGAKKEAPLTADRVTVCPSRKNMIDANGNTLSINSSVIDANKEQATCHADTPETSLDAETLSKMEDWAPYLTLNQLAACLNMPASTLYQAITQQPVARAVWEKAKSGAILSVAKSLYQKALEGNMTACMFYLKSQGGWKDTLKDSAKTPQLTPADDAPDTHPLALNTLEQQRLIAEIRHRLYGLKHDASRFDCQNNQLESSSGQLASLDSQFEPEKSCLDRQNTRLDSSETHLEPAEFHREDDHEQD